MANALYEAMGKQQNTGGIAGLMQQIQEFQRSFRGDPRAEVERLMQSGQMTQDQFNALAQQTNQILQMFKR